MKFHKISSNSSCMRLQRSSDDEEPFTSLQPPSTIMHLRSHSRITRPRSYTCKIMIGLALFAFSGCEQPGAPESANVSGSTPEAPRAQHLWRATLSQTQGDGVLKIKPRDQDTFSPLSPGQSIHPGDTIATGATSLASFAIEPGGGELQLGAMSELTLRKDGPGLVVHRGHVRLESPKRAELADGTRSPAPTIILPSGQVELVGTNISVDASAEQSKISVTHGEVLAIGAKGEELRAHFGQEIVLRDGHAPRLENTPDIGHAFSWSETLKPLEEIDLPELDRGMGKLVARRPYSEQEQPLELKQHDIKVRIQGMMAYTEITEEFHNPGNDNLEGLYRFPLPPDAQISRLSLLVGNRWMEGQFVENARAERIWRAITTEPRVTPRDPALLQWKQGNQFELRIFPIPPRSSRKITIGYVQRLDATGDGYRYTYPMPIDRTGQSKAGKFVFDATVQGLASDAPLQVERYERAEVVKSQDGSSSSVHFEQEDFQPAGDLSLKFTLPEARQQMRAYVYEPESTLKKDTHGAYVAVSLRPQFESGYTTKGKDFVLVLDHSYGRKGPAMTIQRALTRRLIEEMSSTDRVRVISCASSCRSLGSKTFSNAELETIQRVDQDLRTLEAQGSTYTIEAMRSASRILEQRGTTDREAHIIYMTDGVVSAGAAHPSNIERSAAELFAQSSPNLSVVSFGGDEDRATLQAIASGVRRGQVVDLVPGESLTAGALDILRRHYSESLESLAIEWPVGVEQVYPEKLPSLLPGEELVVVARLGRDLSNANIVLKGKHLGQEKRFSYPLDLSRTLSSKGNAFVPRLWAKHRIDALELQDGDTHKEIVKLSRDFGILTRYTSLLALENDAMMREFDLSYQKHMDWTGDEAPAASASGDEELAEVEEEAKASHGPAAKPARSSSKARRSPSSKTMGSIATRLEDEQSAQDDLFGRPQDTMATGEGDEMDKEANLAMPREAKKESKPMPAKRRSGSTPRYCRNETVYGLSKDDTEPSSSDTRRAERAHQKLQKDLTNRTAYMDTIRRFMKLGPSHQVDAEKVVAQWLEINDMDPEAIVMRGQVALNRGDIEEATRWLFSAPDAAARAPWLLERVKLASHALGDEAMSCAYRWTLEDTSKTRDANKNPLECAPSTPESELFDNAREPSALQHSSLVEEKPRRTGRAIDLELTWDDPTQDLHIILVEPSGRLLSFMSQRQRLHVEREPGKMRLALPSRRSGDYEVRILQADPSRPMPSLFLKAKNNSKSASYNEFKALHNQTVLKLTQRHKRRCY